METTHYLESNALEGKTLKLRNRVTFGKLKYRVYKSYLENIGNSQANDEVFKILGIADKDEFCKRYYGYDPLLGKVFPESRDCDYQGLTRVAMALMRLFEIRTVAGALKECSCIKTDPKTKSLIPLVEELEESIGWKNPKDFLANWEIIQITNLFNLAEIEIHQPSI